MEVSSFQRTTSFKGEVVEASRREARVPREGDPVSALPTTPCVSDYGGVLISEDVLASKEMIWDLKRCPCTREVALGRQ